MEVRRRNTEMQEGCQKPKEKEPGVPHREEGAN